MNVVDLDGLQKRISLVGYTNKPRKTSKYHALAKELLQKKYPTIQILEELPIPLRKRQTAYLDFYLPLLKTAIEVHGEQHYKFNGHFFYNKRDFLMAQKRDNEKRVWCELNNIKLIELKYDEYERWYDNINCG